MLKILIAPNPILREVSTPIEVFDSGLKDLANTMIRLTKETGSGIGLSLVQIGIPKQMMILSEDKINFTVICNPVTIESSGSCLMREGCLSQPGEQRSKWRASEVEITYQDLDGNRLGAKLTGLAARVYLHEFSHFQGLLMTDD